MECSRKLQQSKRFIDFVSGVAYCFCYLTA